MKILIVDPFQTGHHLNYLYHISEAFLKNGTAVVVVGDINEEFFGKFEQLSAQYSESLVYSVMSDEHGGYNDRVSARYTDVVKSRWRAIINEYEIHGGDFDLVFLPWLDSYIDGRIEKKFYNELPFKWVAIYFQPYFLDVSIRDITKNRFLDPEILFSHESCIGLGALVNTECVGSHPLFDGLPIYMFPDFADMEIKEISDFAKEINVKRRGRYTIGLYGSLARRKGFLQLLKAIDEYGMGDEFYFIIAGELISSNFTAEERRDILEVVEDNSDALFYHPQRLDTEPEFNYLVSECDVVFAVYLNFYFSSNMLIKGASLRKPLVATRQTYMGDEVERYSLGLAIDSSPKSICKAIKQLKEKHESIIDKNKQDEYIERQSLYELEKAVSKVIEGTMNTVST